MAVNKVNGHYIVTYFKDDINKNNYFRDLEKNKSAKVVYGSGLGAATSPTALAETPQMGLVGATNDTVANNTADVNGDATSVPSRQQMQMQPSTVFQRSVIQQRGKL